MPILSASLLMAITSCAPELGLTHLSPSGRFQVRFNEAYDVGEATQDSYYSIMDRWNPDHHYSSIGGSVPPENDRIFWSPTERTLVIPEAVSEESGCRRSINLVQINPESHEFDQNLIYMRPLEKARFMGEKAHVVAVTDCEVIFQGANDHKNKAIAFRVLLEESRRNLSTLELADPETNKPCEQDAP
jgi:hypothetical protein